MSIVRIISVLIGSIFVAIIFTISAQRILNCKIPKRLSILLAFVFLILTIFLSSLYLDNALKMMAIYVIALFINKIIFNKNLFQCAVTSLFSYLLLSAGEVFVAILISLAIKAKIITDTAMLMNTIKGDVFFNLLISLSTYLFLLLTYKKLRQVVNNIKENNKFTYIFAFSILLVVLCALFYKLFFNNYLFNENFIFVLLLILAVSYISFLIIKQSYDKNRISNEYEKYVEYSKQSEKLVEDYSISQHENKNELIIIRSMVYKSNKKLLEYLDEIINNKDNVENAWIRYLRYIPFGGLKGIIHNKISEMKSNNIKVFLTISNEVGKSHLKELTMKENNQLSKIIGVFLDNAKEASELSLDKEVSINIFVDNKTVVFEISNSYNGKIDISKIYESNYTSKGRGRGYGLALVKSIVEESGKFINEIKVIDNYFVQTLKVKK